MAAPSADVFLPAQPAGGGGKGKLLGLPAWAIVGAVVIGGIVVVLLARRRSTASSQQQDQSAPAAAPAQPYTSDLPQPPATDSLGPLEQSLLTTLEALQSTLVSTNGSGVNTGGTLPPSPTGQPCGEKVPKGQAGNACPAGYRCKHGKCQAGAAGQTPNQAPPPGATTNLVPVY